MSVEDNKAIERRVIEEVFNQGKLEIIPELLSQDYVYHGPGGMEFKGPEGFTQFVSMFRNAFPDINLKIQDMVAEGNKVLTRFTGSGTHQGELMGIPPTGKQVATSGMVVVCVENGKCVEAWENFDQLLMLQQLGAIPPNP